MVRGVENIAAFFLARFVVACAFTCLLTSVVCLAPGIAWGDERESVPAGVLTLCDNPFAIDCGHNHGEEAPTSQSEVSQHPAPSQDDEASMPVQDSTPQTVQDIVGIDVEGPSVQEAQTPSSTDASSNASKPERTPGAFAASFEEARVAVEDEGLFRHEHATILAEVKAGISRSEFNELVESVGGLDGSGVTDEDLVYGLVRLGITNGLSVMETISRVKQAMGFLGAQPNYVYRLAEEEESHIVVDDDYATRQWGLYNANVYAAWDLAKVQGSVAVAVIDTGADLDHPDLAPNIVATHNSYSNANTVEDQVGHGTHVAGIIAGVANNGEGVAGVSYNANLVIIKAAPYKSNDFDTASIARAYSWLESLDSSGKTVAEHYNVRIVNLSVSGFDTTLSANMPDDVLNHAIKKARDECGLLTVVAAGNGFPFEMPYYSYPGDSDACISVMNLCETYNDAGEPNGVELDHSSNYNVPGSKYKDICAPGEGIHSTWIDGKYAIDSGTSMAAPFVSGIAALMLAVNPYLTPQMIISALEASASDLGDEGWDETYGYGGVNAAAAVRRANTAHIDGFRAIGVGGSAGFSMFPGYGMEEDGSGYSWDIWQDGGYASIDGNGVLHGWDVGTVTVVGTYTATTGAEISTTKTVYILDPEIIGENVLKVGESSSPYTTTDPRWTWVWQVENLTGSAHVDQDAILVADEPGIVYINARCASNTDIFVEYCVEIVE